MKVRVALLSVFDKSGLVEFAQELHSFGVEILSTGGTAQTLRKNDLPITQVSQVTGSPELMDGRVKTLHPKIHGGILAVRSNPAHVRQAQEHGIRLIDLVCVNLYPFEKIAYKLEGTRQEAIENIDIGGPAMLRAAAKNHAYVTVVMDPADYPRVIAEMRQREGQVGERLRRELAVKAFSLTALYDAAIAAYLEGQRQFPEFLHLPYRKVEDLRYGENPHQEGACYRTLTKTGASVAHSRFLGGKELSYNNFLDLDAAFELVREFSRPAAAIIKHNNPCGAATAPTAAEAFAGALEGDPLSAYGGIVAFNTAVDEETADRMTADGNFFEAVIAPSFAEGALKILREKPKWGKNVRLLESGEIRASGGRSLSIKGIREGLLVQTWDQELHNEWTVITGEVTESQKADLQFAWTVCKHVKSNAIVLAKDRKVVGVGAGQMSRFDAAELAVHKAGKRARGSIAASDAFFPFPDALTVLANAGVTAAVHPGGSIRDKQVAAAAKVQKVALVVTGMRHFRH